MLSATIKYGAIRAKVMALYGQMLDRADIDRLCGCGSLSDFASVLRSCRGWGERLSMLTSRPDEEKLKETVRDRVYEDYGKIWSFCSLADKKLLTFTVNKAEYSALLYALRRLRTGESHFNSAAVDFLSKYGSLDMAALKSCEDYSELLAAAGKSIFAPILRSLETDGISGLPDYREASVALENAYYREMFSYVDKKYSGQGKRNLEELLGTEADWLNVVSILRVLRYFPASAARGESLLIPVSQRLKPALAKKLFMSRSPEEAISVLSGTLLGKSLADADLSRPEKLYSSAMEAFCRKLIRLPEPNICTAQAYLTLRELECEKLVRIIEAISCGADPYSAV